MSNASSITTPVWPTDFQHLYSEGADYWWWSPETGPGYDGTWPIGTEPPSGLMVTCAEADDPLEWGGEEVAVSWEYGPETESGPFLTRIDDYPNAVQVMVDEVMRQVREEKEVVNSA